MSYEILQVPVSQIIQHNYLRFAACKVPHFIACAKCSHISILSTCECIVKRVMQTYGTYPVFL